MQPQVGSPSVVQPQAVQPIIIQTTHQPAPRRYDSLLARPVKFLGALQVSAGALCILFQIVAIVIHAALGPVGHGIWCGIFFIIAGAFGCVAGSQKTLCPIVTFMVMSIIAACMVAPLLSFAAIGVAIEEQNEYEFDYNTGYYISNKIHARKAMNGLLIGLALFEAVIAIVSAALCCHGVCCCRTASQGAVLSYPGQNIQYVTGQPGTSQGQMIIIQNTGQTQPGMQPTVIYPQAGAPNPGYPVQNPAGQPPYQQLLQQPAGGPVQPPQYTDAPPSYNPNHEKASLPQQQI